MRNVEVWGGLERIQLPTNKMYFTFALTCCKTMSLFFAVRARELPKSVELNIFVIPQSAPRARKGSFFPYKKGTGSVFNEYGSVAFAMIPTMPWSDFRDFTTNQNVERINRMMMITSGLLDRSSYS